MKTNPYTLSVRAFTLLELLVVMSIIAILATAGLKVGAAAKRVARKAQAHNDCLIFVNSLSQYRALEMPFPKAWDGGQSTNGPFLAALLGEKSKWNRTCTAYFGPGRVTNNPRAHGHVVTRNQFNDPWGMPYQIHLDTEEKGELTLPPAYGEVFGSQVTGRPIFVHSAGPDGDFSTVDDNITVQLGVVPTHIKFVGGLVPDEAGRLPRGEDGKLLVLTEMATLVGNSSVKIGSAQISVFPGVASADNDEMIEGLKALGLAVHLILMVGGADPMNPEDEDKVVEMLVSGLELAKKHGVEQVASTSVEAWMQAGAQPKAGAAFEAAIAQNVQVHTRAYREAGLAGSGVKAWHIEFLRGGEFQTFTDIAKIWAFVRAVNESLGKPFFKVMVDAAHCGDSALTIPEHEAVIQEIAEAGALGIFHASAKTTRGCLTTDDGWIGALLSACARTGQLEFVFVELFHHDDPALEGLRQLDSGHGIDTTDGRSYTATVLDGLAEVAHRLNNLVARGILPAA